MWTNMCQLQKHISEYNMVTSSVIFYSGNYPFKWKSHLYCDYREVNIHVCYYPSLCSDWGNFGKLEQTRGEEDLTTHCPELSWVSATAFENMKTNLTLVNVLIEPWCHLNARNEERTVNKRFSSTVWPVWYSLHLMQRLHKGLQMVAVTDIQW